MAFIWKRLLATQGHIPSTAVGSFNQMHSSNSIQRILFTGNPLNRQSSRRSNTKELLEERNLKARFIVFNHQQFLQTSVGRVAWVQESDLQPEYSLENVNANSVFLGMDEQMMQPYWAVDVSSSSALILKLEIQPGIRKFVNSRPAAFSLPTFEASILAQGLSLVDWNLRHVYCPSCGSKTVSGESGYKRLCNTKTCVSYQSIQNYSYPRTDPAIIIAVGSTDGQRLLLGRQKNWASKVYSCIAGFMEPGESIDEACKREVFEETNVLLRDVRFHSSQPWPFPSQLMLGCIGVASKENIIIHDGELEDAKWFTKDEVKSALNGNSTSLKLSTSISISYSLVHTWAHSSLSSAHL
ncbi:NADH pyrophosphatase [Batrachochytrium dendrobatidis]|nr:NADH pyrophosphatase [Batrachochytrium dendrobatidis]